mgnify:FL=1
MAKTDELFKKLLIEKTVECEKLTGIKGEKFIQNIEKFGAVEACRNTLKRKQYFNGFLQLKEKNRLDLSVESLVTDSRFSTLFSDDEVNFCFESLCEAGYFN